MRRDVDHHTAEQETRQKGQPRIPGDVVIHRTCVTPGARNGWSNGADSVRDAITKLVDLRAVLIAQFREQLFDVVNEVTQAARLIHRDTRDAQPAPPRAAASWLVPAGSSDYLE